MGGLIVLAGGVTCFGGEIVWIHGGNSYPLEEEQIRTVADFYGLDLRPVDVASPGGQRQAVSWLKSRHTLAALISEDALSRLDWGQIHAAIRRPKSRYVPMLVFGITAGHKTDELKLWSAGAISDCVPLAPDLSMTMLNVGSADVVTHALAGMRLPLVAFPSCSLRFEPARTVGNVLTARGNDQSASILLRVVARSVEIFFVPQIKQIDSSWIGKPSMLQKAFSSMAPFIVFLRYAAGDYGWHLDQQYANFTIDDPWLRQPHSHLDYPGLLAEMQKHSFHTTIAFIPWNFERSEAKVVDLFRGYPERFSICIHGNDHAHREFGDYTVNSLRDQVEAIRQSVARMERFRTLTGIPYDRFMVFPHDVAPEQTFAALRKYGFLGTANFLNVPMEATFPDSPAFLLRPYTLAYGHLPSLSRYPATTSQVEIAVQMFLGNPLLFYSHESLFKSSIGEFNSVADLVNRLHPETRWTSLGKIARHLHLVRKGGDSLSEIRMISNDLDLENPTDQGKVYLIRREVGPPPYVPILRIDGVVARFEQTGNMLTLRLAVPPRQIRELRVTYPDAADISGEVVTKGSVYALALRHLSDIRDLHMSQFSGGRSLIRAYYRYRLDSAELLLERRWGVGAASVALLLFVTLAVRRRGKRAAVRQIND